MDIAGVGILLALIGFTLWLSERLGRKNARLAFLSRKLLHIVGVGSLAIAPVFISSYVLLLFIALGASAILLIAVKRHWLVADIYNRPSWGIALFPLSFCLLWLLFGAQDPSFVIYPMLVLTFSDAGAAIVGGLFARKKYNLTGDEKSILGSVTFAIIALFVLAFLPMVLEKLHPFFTLRFGEVYVPERIWLIFPVIAIFAAVAEGSTSGGWDNVSVPFSVAWVLAVLPGTSLLNTALPVMAALGVLAFFAWRKKWLDAAGSVIAALLGFVIYIGSGWQGLLLIGLFFISGSLLGKLPKGVKDIGSAKMGKPRDYMQVLCNGGAAGACIICFGLTHNDIFLILFSVSVAISTADTWSSEVGVWARGKVMDIVKLRPLPIGISGGISWQGTLAGLAGATFIGYFSWFFELDFPIWVILFGFAGMLVDSVMGSIWQARYLYHKNVVEEVPDSEIINPEKGLKWMTNDLVNLLSNLFVTILAGFLIYFCG